MSPVPPAGQDRHAARGRDVDEEPAMTQPTYSVPVAVAPQSSAYPTTPYPTTPYPTAQYPTAPYPAAPYPSAHYPTAHYPTAYPPALYPTDPSSGYPYPADPYLTATPAPPHWVPVSSQPEYPQQQYPAPHEYPTQPQPVDGVTAMARPVRPAVLSTAVLAGLVSSVLVVISQLLGLAGARAAIQAAIARQVSPADAVSPYARAAADHAYATIQNRAHISIGLAVVVALFLVLALQAGISTRITAVVFMGLTATVTFISISDVFPGVAIVVGAVALVLIPVTTALLFLPAVGRFRTARRAWAATAA
jgi:hypothetical protein